MRGYPQFSFWISITLVKICFSRIFSKPRKNTFELVGTVLNKLFMHLSLSVLSKGLNEWGGGGGKGQLVVCRLSVNLR